MVWRDNMGTLSGRVKLVINSIKADTDRTHRIRKSLQIKLELRVGNRKYFRKIFNFYIANILIVSGLLSVLIIRYCSIIGQYYLFSLVRAWREYWCYVGYPIISSGKFHPSSAPTDQENKDGSFYNLYFLRLMFGITSGDWSPYDWL